MTDEFAKPIHTIPLIGYARVSTEDQTPLPQAQALKAAGCAEIHEEHALVEIGPGPCFK